MKRVNTILIVLVIGLMTMGLFAANPTSADDDDGHSEKRGKRVQSEKSAYQYAAPQNAEYTQECSSCHFLYQPGFLPARSWIAIVDGSDKHFGEDLAIVDADRKKVIDFLTANSAERSDFRWSAKILKQVGSETPERITELAYIKKEHRKIKPDVFKRPSIGTHSNCGACHPKGAQGDFEEDSVVIPAK